MLVNLFSVIILCILLVVLYFLYKKPNSKHKDNIKQGDAIVNRINKFNFDGQRINYLRKIDPFVFEELLISAFKKKGYKIERNLKYTGDGGYDGVLYDKNSNKILIQAKRYSNYVSSQHIKVFEQLVISHNAYKGYFIHTGKTGKATFGSYKVNSDKIEIISGSRLLKLIEK